MLLCFMDQKIETLIEPIHELGKPTDHQTVASDGIRTGDHL